MGDLLKADIVLSKEPYPHAEDNSDHASLLFPEHHSTATLEEVVELAEPLVQEVVVVAESTTSNPVFFPTPSVEIRVHERGKSAKKGVLTLHSAEPWWPWID